VPTFRYYAVAGLNGKRKGTMSALVPVPVDDPPPAPAAPTVTVAEGRIDLNWEAPDGLRRPIIKVTLAPATAPVPTVAAPATPDEQPPPEDEDETPKPDEQEPAAPPPTDATASAVPEPGLSPPRHRRQQQPSAPAAQRRPAKGSAAAAQNPDAAADGTADETPKTLPARNAQPVPDDCLRVCGVRDATVRLHAAGPATGLVPPYPVQLTTPPGHDAEVERCAIRSGRGALLRAANRRDHRDADRRERAVTIRVREDAGRLRSGRAEEPRGRGQRGRDQPDLGSEHGGDLAGYMVLRAPAVEGGKLVPITPAPIKETTFRDTKVRAGVRYAYVVVAVDTATPQNVSAQSNRVEETAR
jgi:hypothetical protein